MVDNSYLDILGVYRSVQELAEGDLIQLQDGERYRIMSLDPVQWNGAHASRRVYIPGGGSMRLYTEVLFLG